MDRIEEIRIATSDEFKAERDFWDSKLTAFPLAAPDFPADLPGASVADTELDFELHEALAGRLLQISKGAMPGLYTLLLSGFRYFLYRYTREPDQVISTPVFQAAWQEGLVSELVLLPGRIAPDQRFKAFIGETKGLVQEVRKHQNFPYSAMIRQVPALEGRDCTPVLFALDNLQHPDFGAGMPFSMRWRFRVEGKRLFLRLGFAQKTCFRESINDLVDAFQVMMGQLMSDSGTILSATRLWDEKTAAAFEPVISGQGFGVEVNARFADLQQSGSLLARFRKQVLQFPERLAVHDRDGEMNYGTLDRDSSRIAQWLKGEGMQAGAVVALFFERNRLFPVGVWGIVKAGGVFLVLDPQLPDDRLRMMLEDAGVGFMISLPELEPRWSAFGLQTLKLDASWLSAGAELQGDASLRAVGGELQGEARLRAVGGELQEDANLLPTDGELQEDAVFEVPEVSEAEPSDRGLYLLYTSGSTGRPKGVLNSEAALITFLDGLEALYPELDAIRHLGLVAFSFDPITWDLFGTLCKGGSLYISARDEQNDPEKLVALIRDYEINQFIASPTLLKTFISLLEVQGANTGVRKILTGAETITNALLARAYACFPAATIVNAYGPTETSVGATSIIWTPDAGKEGNARIGRALPGFTVRILGPDCQAEPPGVPGEIYISGPVLAMGYLGRGAKTAAVFVPDPYAAEPGQRMYRTGDLGRYDGKGQLEFKGRIDSQVKLRGFRIELGEIEYWLQRAVGVEEAVVQVVKDGEGYERLFAWYSGTEQAVKAIRAFLGERLPDYMIPAGFQHLESFPRLASRKVNRKALPEPDFEQGGRGAVRLPENEIQEILTSVWKSVLRVDAVGIDDNFFELGGDSILAIQIVSRSRAAGLRFAAKDLFRHQEILSLSQVTRQVEEQEEKDEPVGAFPMTPIQQWFFRREGLHPEYFNMAFSFRIPLDSNLELLEAAIEAVIRHHDVFRSVFRESDGVWQAEILSGIEPGFLVIEDLEAGSGKKEVNAGEQKWQEAFNLEQGPLFRAVLFRIPDHEFMILSLIIHHLVVDGVSWRIVPADLERAYLQLSRGEEVDLGPKSCSFRNWALRMHAQVQSPALQASAAYWQRVAKLPSGDLPVVAGEAAAVMADQVHHLSLDADSTRFLLGQAAGVWQTQINDLLLSAAVLALRKWTGSPQWQLDLEAHGREDFGEGLDVSRTVGWFTQMYPVVLEARNTVIETIKGVKEHLRGVPDGGLSYGMLRFLADDPALAGPGKKHSSADISLNYLGQADTVFDDNTWLVFHSRQEGSRNVSESFEKQYNLEIEGIVLDGCLELMLVPKAGAFLRDQMLSLENCFLGAFASIVSELKAASGGYTPSDFPLAKLNQAGLDLLVETVPGGKANVESIWPLSPLQQGMLFKSKVEPDQRFYHQVFCAEIHQEMEVEAFRKACRALQELHPVLRTAFYPDRFGRPVQVVFHTVPELFSAREISAGTGIADWVAHWMEEAFHDPFVPDAAPLMRIELARAAEDHYVLATRHHHVIMDGWSLPILTGDLLHLYSSLVNGAEVVGRKALSAELWYAWLDNRDRDASMAFWQSVLQGGAWLSAPGFKRVLPGRTGIHTLSRPFEDAFTRRVQDFCKGLRITSNTLFQAVWSLALAGFTGQQRVGFGTTVSGRPGEIPGVEGIVGMFINSVPVVVDCTPDQLFSDFLVQMQELQIRREAHDWVPLADIQAFVDLEAGEQLFESLVVFENYPMEQTVSGEGQELAFGEVFTYERTDIPLTVMAMDSPVFYYQLTYDVGQYREADLAAFLNLLDRLIRAAVDGFDGTVAGIIEQAMGEWRREVPVGIADFGAGGDGRAVKPDLQVGSEGVAPGGLDDLDSGREVLSALFASLPEAFAVWWSTLTDQVAVLGEGEATRSLVSGGNAHLTYRELEQLSRHVAGNLVLRGLGPESRVAVLMDRSVDLVCVLAGILRAGCTYVALDTETPVSRLKWILADAGVELLVTGGADADFSDAGADGNAVFDVPGAVADGNAGADAGPGADADTDADSNAFAVLKAKSLFSSSSCFGGPEDLPLPDPEQLAYILYTSGTSGRPKGVMISHRSLMHYVRNALEAYAFRVGEWVPFHGSPAFDATVTSLWPALSGSTVLPLAGGADGLLDWLHALGGRQSGDFSGELVFGEKEGGAASREDLGLVSGGQEAFKAWTGGVLKVTPSHLEYLRGSLDVLPVRKLVVGGEAFSVSLGRSLAGLAKGGEVVNEYGPTEATVGCISWSFSATGEVPGVEAGSWPEWEGGLPIGRPMPGVRAYVLDAALRPAGLLQTGVLYLGGPGLARGYAGLPGLTAGSFLPDPFADTPGQRMYRTGDLARWLPDGNLEFLGRADAQLKVRGYRIESEEVEAALESLDGVLAAGVILDGRQRLQAFVRVSGPFRAETLRGALAGLIPAYAVPFRIHQLNQLPLTTQGKLDRRALVALLPDESFSGQAGRFHSPEEELLASIWSSVLGVEIADRNSDFFQLGGHSLLATQVQSRIREAFSLELPLGRLFDHALLKDLAALLYRERFAERAAVLNPVSLADRGQDLALSFSQQRLWFLDQLEGANATYITGAALRLKGRLDVEVLQEALHALVRRHEPLRTRFPVSEGRAVQLIDPDGQAAWQVTDLRELDQGAVASGADVGAGLTEQGDDQVLTDVGIADRESRMKGLLAEALSEPFDLAEDQLVRAHLIRLGDEDHALAIAIHHIVSDGWSVGVIVAELAHFYGAFLSETAPALPSLAVQYADYAGWQRDLLESGGLDFQLDYWRAKLDGAPPLLALPTDRPRPGVQTFKGDVLIHRLNPDLSARLNEIAREQGVTLYMLLLAAFYVQLYRYSGVADLVVGSPVANRNRQALEGLVGFFVNTLVMRTSLHGNPGFAELLKRVRETALGAYQHQDLPFEYLVEQLEPERNLSYTPLFQVLFVLQNAPLGDLDLPGLSLENVDLEGQTSKFDLSLYVQETEAGMLAWIEYNTDLFDRERIVRMMGQYECLLEAVCAWPEARLSDLGMLPDDEMALLKGSWRGEVRHESDAQIRSLHSGLQRGAALWPDRNALRTPVADFSYRELEQRSNQWAHWLLGQGVGREAVVAVRMKRGMEQLAAVLGVLKAGGAYLPVHPSWPEERIEFALADAGCRLLLDELGDLKGAFSAGGLSDKGAVVSGFVGGEFGFVSGEAVRGIETDGNAIRVPVFQVSGVLPLLADQPVSVPEVDLLPEQLAYVLYTSGSTGQPKGVGVAHASVSALMDWVGHHVQPMVAGVQEGDGHDLGAGAGRSGGGESSAGAEKGEQVLATTTLAFDISIFELFAVWERGGTVLLADDVLDLGQFPLASEATLLNTVPSALRELLRVDALPDALELVCVAGEALDRDLAEALFALRPSVRLFNLYGPSETTVYSSWTEIKAGESGIPALGRPLPGEAVYVLDAYLRPAPAGVVGELWIGGTGLARGYVEQPGLSAAAFVPDPFSEAVGARMYRTGDLGWFDFQGQLHFSGRKDTQLKFNGYRIEAGEVEALLQAMPEVNQAAVGLGKDDQGLAMLSAWIVRETAGSADGLSAASESELVDQWKQIWELTYSQEASGEVPEVNVVGWTDSFTGEAIPLAAMQSWLAATLDQLRPLKADRVLEIGVGTGMLLFGLAPHCRQYTGLDLSENALDYIRGHLGLLADFPVQVELECRAAHELEALIPGGYDLIILNSVVQYFPSIEYLDGVLKQALKLLAPGGHLFVGDVRHPDLLAAFVTGVQLHRAEAAVDPETLQTQIREGMDAEEELLVHPDYFRFLARREADIGEVAVGLKLGAEETEMGRFRYDVMIHAGLEEVEVVEGEVVSWVEGLDVMAAAGGDWPVRITGIPNVRLKEERSGGDGGVLDPATYVLGLREAGLDARAVWGKDPFRWDLIAGSGRQGGQVTDVAVSFQPLRSWANQPVRGKLSRKLIPVLRAALEKQVPAYMVPSAFMMLDAMPRLANGKLDRKALPDPAGRAALVTGPVVLPQTNTEMRLLLIWEAVLGRKGFGIQQDFFRIGGHSILAVQLLDQVNRSFGMQLPLATLFEHQTIAALGALLDARVATKPWSPVVRIQPLGSEPPLFLFHPAGGNVLCYLHLAKALGPDQPVIGFQAPGMVPGQDLLAGPKAYAEYYLDYLLAEQAEGPYRVAGWSLGGQIAYEMACLLAERGLEVAYLGVIDAFPQEAYPEQMLKEHLEGVSMWVELFPELKGLEDHLELLQGLSRDERMDFVLDFGVQQGVVSADADRDQIGRYMRLFAHNGALAFEPAAYAGSLHLLVAAERERAVPDNASLVRSWERYVGNRMEVVEVPGRHLTLMAPQFAAEVGAAILKVIDFT